MTPSFSIDFNWLHRDYGCAEERATLAELVIRVGSCCITELEDRIARTVRPGARLSAYQLAQWFALNWWRLRWEPKRNTINWKLAHQIGAAGKGYLWPDISLSSDGGTVTIRARPTAATDTQPVRYLNTLDAAIAVDDFEKAIQNFMDGVIGRLDNEVQSETALKTLWREILQERSDPASSNRRKLEAIMGFDPGDAPDLLLDMLEKMKNTYGCAAIEEIAAASPDNAAEDVNLLWNSVRPESVPLRIPRYDVIRQRLSENAQRLPPSPWRYAETAARITRQEWEIKAGPISNKIFEDILHIPQNIIWSRKLISDMPMSVGFREDGDINAMSVYIDRKPVTSRRFALGRLVGDLIGAENCDRLLPVTEAVTQRQKFQRAFAQELLCPFTELSEFLGSRKPDDNVIEDAAALFEVSPLMIRTILVSKEIIHRDALLMI
jgi:hypothetical protein